MEKETERRNKISEYHKKNHLKNPFKGIYTDYKNTAKRRNLDFTISYELCKKLFSSRCHYCNILPNNTKNLYYKNNKIRYVRDSYNYQGIDRINSDFGYIDNNVVPCCSKCNYAKRQMNYFEFLNWIEQVYLNKVQRLESNLVGSSDSKWKVS